MSPPEPTKALVGDAKLEATLYLSNDSLLWKSNQIGGISLSSVKMVEAEDDSTLSIGYSSGTRIESVRIRLRDKEFAWNKPLLKWYLHLVQSDVLTTTAMKVFQQYYLAYRHEIENLFDIAFKQNKSIREINNIGQGDAFWHKPVHVLNQLLEKEYPELLKYHPKDQTYSQSPQRIYLSDFPKFPYEMQLNCAKLYYLIFLARVTSAKSALVRNDQNTLYSDTEGMTPDDYEKFFIHFGLISQPILPDEFKIRLLERSDIDYLEDANGPRPKDYKQWFLRPVALTFSK
ncbi:MAG: hypothetical protein JRN52_08520 [Nitrososphaerota archaeon]|nr:hypothetical protein [Nitrososphaerota archaeon]